MSSNDDSERISRDSGPYVLIATDDEQLRGELIGLLPPSYRATTTATATATLERARAAPTAVAIIDHTPDMSSTELCRRLHEVPEIGPDTAIVITLPDADPAARREAVHAGAWSVLSRPIDPEEFRAKVETYGEAKLYGGRAKSDGLVDRATGMYNQRGVAHWARELGALAWRRRTAFACIASAPSLPDGASPAETDAAVGHLTDVLRSVHRGGDVIGRVGRSEFVVLALETNTLGARLYARRLTRASRNAGPGAYPLRFASEAVENVRGEPFDAVEMVARASRALRHAASEAR